VVTDRTVVVTGAASGIGSAVARGCLAAGDRVVGLDLDSTGLATVAASGGQRFLPLVVDVSDPVAVAGAAAEVGSRSQVVHGLVNAAGIGGFTGDVVATERSDWDRTLLVNLTAVFIVSQAFVPLMRDAEGASVVHVSSQYGLVGGAGSPAYCAAKAGLIGLTRAMAVDHAHEGLRVNCLCPGPIDTPMLRRSVGSGDSSTTESTRTAHRSLLPAPGHPDDVAALAVFLLGQGARNMTGSVVPVDGGWSAA